MSIVYVWSAIAALGAAATLAVLADAIHDWRAVRAVGRNAARRLVARGSVRREWLRLAVQALFLLAGAVTYLVRVQVLAPTPFVAWALVASSLLIAANTVADFVDGRRLKALLE